MSNRLKRVFVSLMMVVPMITAMVGFGMDKTYAAEDTVSITLNKKAVDTYPTEIQNTGEAMGEFD